MFGPVCWYIDLSQPVHYVCWVHNKFWSGVHSLKISEQICTKNWLHQSLGLASLCESVRCYPSGFKCRVYKMLVVVLIVFWILLLMANSAFHLVSKSVKSTSGISVVCGFKYMHIVSLVAYWLILNCIYFRI